MLALCSDRCSAQFAASNRSFDHGRRRGGQAYWHGAGVHYVPGKVFAYTQVVIFETGIEGVVGGRAVLGQQGSEGRQASTTRNVHASVLPRAIRGVRDKRVGVSTTLARVRGKRDKTVNEAAIAWIEGPEAVGERGHPGARVVLAEQRLAQPCRTGKFAGQRVRARDVGLRDRAPVERDGACEDRPTVAGNGLRSGGADKFTGANLFHTKTGARGLAFGTGSGSTAAISEVLMALKVTTLMDTMSNEVQQTALLSKQDTSYDELETELAAMKTAMAALQTSELNRRPDSRSRPRGSRPAQTSCGALTAA